MDMKRVAPAIALIASIIGAAWSAHERDMIQLVHSGIVVLSAIAILLMNFLPEKD